MFGYFRFFLAFLVLLSHTGTGLQGFNPGVAAVVSFYMLAGFVVCNLFSKVFVAKRQFYPLFYYERCLRIFPQYLFITVLTVIFIFVTQYGAPKFEWAVLINNFLIIPLNYFMFVDNAILTDPEWWLIPPAWSLGTELQAYLLLPFVICFKSFKIIFSILSLLIFIVASMGGIHTDYFGYRLLPGVLFIFILGVLIYNNTNKESRADYFDQYFPIITYVILIFLLIVLGLKGELLVPYVRETILGVLIGLPIITYIAGSNIKLPINHLIGDLSYGLFLSHFLAIWIIDYYSLIDKSAHLILYVITVFAISLLVALIGVLLVEKNIKKYRFNLSKSAGKESPMHIT